MTRRGVLSLFFFGVGFVLGLPAPAQVVLSAGDHAEVTRWRFSPPISVPEGGIRIERDVATWVLESGEVRLQSPLHGVSTGLVFRGRGRFSMRIPHALEREQLARFSEDPELGEIEDLAFSEMVLRASDVSQLADLDVPEAAARETDPLAKERHEDWLEHRQFDVDARILAALGTPDDPYLRAEMKTERFDWTTFEYDPWRQEEISLSVRERGFTETWVSLDRGEDRRADGSPSPTRRDLLRIPHADVTVDLTEAGDRPRAGVTRTHPRNGKFVVAFPVVPEVQGLTVLPLELSPWAEVRSVRTGERALPYVRHHLGGRTRSLDKDLWDETLLVLLDGPAAAGEPVPLVVEYDLEIYNYVGGRGWYPLPREGFLDLHTGTIELTIPDKIDFRAMGDPAGEPSVSGGVRRGRWEVSDPTFMLSFTIAERPESYELAPEDDSLPLVEAFGPGMDSEAKFHNVAADVTNAVAFFTEVFDEPLDSEKLVVSSITAGHGQSFRGFVHMTEFSFYRERTGATELFRAHETAHQWWGHLVGWETYRDQWLSEGASEYSSLMFLEAVVPNGEKQMQEALAVYRDNLVGSISQLFSNYAAPGLVSFNEKERERMGPIALGYRASTADVPAGYFAQSYTKGAYVFHMLRTMLRNMTKSDDLFVRILRDVFDRHRGGKLSTEAFREIVRHRAPADWTWFFEQWVYGKGIPTYVWSHEVEKAPRGSDHEWELALRIRQEDVPPGFKMPVPVRLDFGRGEEGQIVVLVDEPEKTVRVPLPAKPRNVELNPGHAVLARVRGG